MNYEYFTQLKNELMNNRNESIKTIKFMIPITIISIVCSAYIFNNFGNSESAGEKIDSLQDSTQR